MIVLNLFQCNYIMFPVGQLKTNKNKENLRIIIPQVVLSYRGTFQEKLEAFDRRALTSNFDHFLSVLR